MKKNMRRLNSAVLIKAVTVLLALFVTLMMSCEGKKGAETGSSRFAVEDFDEMSYEEANGGEIADSNFAVEETPSGNAHGDPFFLFYIRNFPTLQTDTSENVKQQRIWYRNFDTKEIDFGDDEDGIFWSTIYLFENGVFCGIDHVAADSDGEQVSRSKSIEIRRNRDGEIDSIDQYENRNGRLIWQHDYIKRDSTIFATDERRNGIIADVIAEEDAKFLYWGDRRRYNATPDKPDTTMEFINGDAIISAYNFLLQSDSSRYYFTDGILMKREFWGNVNRTETYTVSSGTGEIIITDNAAGEEVERRTLERRINDAGYLEYEAVKHPNGTGYEFFIAKETP